MLSHSVLPVERRYRMWSLGRKSQLDCPMSWSGLGRDEQGPSRRGASQTRRAQTFSSRLGCWGRRCAGCLGGRFGRGRGPGFVEGTGRGSISTRTCHRWVGGPYVVQTQRRPEAGSGSARRMRAQQSPRRGGQDGAHQRDWVCLGRHLDQKEISVFNWGCQAPVRRTMSTVFARSSSSLQKFGGCNDNIGASNGGDVIPWLGPGPCSRRPEPLKCPATPRPQTATASCCRRDIFLI